MRKHQEFHCGHINCEMPVRRCLCLRLKEQVQARETNVGVITSETVIKAGKPDESVREPTQERMRGSLLSLGTLTFRGQGNRELPREPRRNRDRRKSEGHVLEDKRRKPFKEKGPKPRQGRLTGQIRR